MGIIDFGCIGESDIMKRLFCIGLVITLTVVMLSGCSLKYNEAFIVGRSMDSIIAQFGEPDGIKPLKNENGEQTGTFIYYNLLDLWDKFFGSYATERFRVWFDQNGVAVKCDRCVPAP